MAKPWPPYTVEKKKKKKTNSINGLRVGFAVQAIRQYLVCCGGDFLSPGFAPIWADGCAITQAMGHIDPRGIEPYHALALHTLWLQPLVGVAISSSRPPGGQNSAPRRAGELLSENCAKSQRYGPFTANPLANAR